MTDADKQDDTNPDHVENGAEVEDEGKGTEDEADEDAYPALDVIQEVVERQIDAQQDRVASMEQRGGVLLGFSGILIGLVFKDLDRIGCWGIVGTLVAVCAGAFAAAVIFPRAANTVGPRQLVDIYLTETKEATQIATMATFADLFDEEEKRVETKGILLRTALVLLPAAGLLLVVGAILNTTDGPDHSGGGDGTTIQRAP